MTRATPLQTGRQQLENELRKKGRQSGMTYSEIARKMWELTGFLCPTRPTRPQRRMTMAKETARGVAKGPVRTLKVGDRLTVYGDRVVEDVRNGRVLVRVLKASAPPPEPVMFSATRHCD